MDERWFLAQLLVSAALAGLCWTVQLAVYPHFARLLDAAGPAGFRDYHAAYTRSMGYVAAPLMLAELPLALLWLVHASAAETTFARLGAAAVAAIWLSTFAVLVPLHRRLQAAPSVALTRRLTLLNWPRTLLWSARALLLASVLATRA